MDRGGVSSIRGFVGPGAGGFPGQEMQQRQLELGQVIRERDQSRSQAVEAVSRAEALEGQLAEATERLAEASARAGTLAEGLTVVVRSGLSPS
jgi:hypothetical protein